MQVSFPLYGLHYGCSLHVRQAGMLSAVRLQGHLANTTDCTAKVRLGAGIMEADDRQVTTVFTVQPSFHHRHSTNRVQYNSDICNSLKRKLGYMQAILGVPAESLLCFTCKNSVKSNSHICKFAYMQVLLRSHPPI